jgi:hypothetical protein
MTSGGQPGNAVNQLSRLAREVRWQGHVQQGTDCAAVATLTNGDDTLVVRIAVNNTVSSAYLTHRREDGSIELGVKIRGGMARIAPMVRRWARGDRRVRK